MSALNDRRVIDLIRRFAGSGGSVSDEAYDESTWNGVTDEAPSKNAVRDKFESITDVTDGDKGDITVSSSGTVWTIDNGAVTAAKVAADVATQAELDAKVSDTTYDESTWNGVTDTAPSKNAVRDKFETLGSAAEADLIDDDDFSSATASNVPSAESTKAYVDGEIANSFLLRLIRQGLTNKSSWSGTASPEQWGTEEAVYTLAGGEPTEVTIQAEANGYCQTGTATANVAVWMEISTDGGSNWNVGEAISVRDEGGASTNNRRPVFVKHQLSAVTPSGQIQARVRGQVATNTTGRTLNGGVIYLTVVGGDPLA